MKITNTQLGSRGVNTDGGVILIAPGETVDLNLSDAEQKVAAATGWFDMPGVKAAAKAAASDDSKTA